MRLIVASVTALSVLLEATTASAAQSDAPDPGLFLGTFIFVMFGIMMVFVLVPLIVHIWALVDISQTKDEAFGPPWDNSKQAWTLGLAVAFFVPFGHLVAPVLWWTQVRGPQKRGQLAGRPFWMQSRPANLPPPGYGAPGYGAPGYGAPGYGAPGYGAPGYGAPGYGAPGARSAGDPPNPDYGGPSTPGGPPRS